MFALFRLHTAVALTAALGLAGCASTFDSAKAPISPTKKVAAKAPVAGEIKTVAKFKAGKRYGPASERIIRSAFAEVPRGGGRAVVGKPYKINGRWYKPRHQPNYNKVGIASWYGPNFHGRKTANGEVYDQTALSAAHPTLPLPSYVRVTNLANNRSVIVRVNDRGPFHKTRIIDLSYRTAELLGTRAGGLGRVRVKYIGPARVDGKDEKYLLASYKGPGSVNPSKVAARKKLLAYAGLPKNEIESVLDGDKKSAQKRKKPVAVAKVPAQKAIERNIKPATVKPSSPAKVVRTTFEASTPAQPAKPTVVTTGLNGPTTDKPLELRPKITFTPVPNQPKLIKTKPQADSNNLLEPLAYWRRRDIQLPF